MDFESVFNSGISYSEFLAKYGTEEQQRRWNEVHGRVQLLPDQQQLLAGFTREMKVLVLAGAWCGDCVNQCPILNHFSAASSCVDIRYYDRDDNPELGELLQTCGAARVPSVLFLSEDNYVCGRYGDRTLARYREMAETQIGPACPSGVGGPSDEMLTTVTQEWLNEFERIQLMLRLSGRLRQKHGD